MDVIDNLTEEDVKKRLIEPALTLNGWDFSFVSMEKRVIKSVQFTDGKVIVKGKKARRGSRKRADYILYTKTHMPIAIIEAKDLKHSVGDGIQQAIDYASVLDVPFAYSSNGKGFIEHDFLNGTNREINMSDFPSPDELWQRYLDFKNFDSEASNILKKPYHYDDRGMQPRYYQRIAINRVVEAVVGMENNSELQKRIMLVMATGTGKTYTAFQIVHKLYSSKLVKKVLYLADRNILIDQTILDDFSPFKEKGILTKIESKHLDSSYDIFMSLYQQLSGETDLESFLQFKPDFFDLVIVDECHRGSARENSVWRKVLDYFSSAIHLGMTATPKETEDVSNIDYFGDPLYTYSLKQGIDDGFLAPYRVLRIGIDKDLESYVPEKGKLDDHGREIEQRVYTQKDFDKNIIIDDRTKTVAKKITEFLKKTDRFSKTIIFCVDTEHANRMRQALINENSDLVKKYPKYIMRITGNDLIGKKEVENFQDSTSLFPTIVTTSDLLATGVNVKMVKVIVLDSMISSMTRFKQIIGRGTRLYWERDKRFFSILDFRKATLLFSDPEFDGPASSVYEGDNSIPVNQLLEEFEEYEFDNDLQVNKPKFYVSDVKTNIISEIELLYGVDGKLVANHADNFSTMINKYFTNQSNFYDTWMESIKSDLIHKFEENGVDFQQLKIQLDNDIDEFDIINHIGFNYDIMLKTERVDSVLNSKYFLSLNSKIQPVILDLLEIYLMQGISSLEDRDVLKLPLFSKYGGLITIVRLFGGKNQYLKSIKNIVKLIYKY